MARGPGRRADPDGSDAVVGLPTTEDELPFARPRSQRRFGDVGGKCAQASAWSAPGSGSEPKQGRSWLRLDRPREGKRSRNDEGKPTLTLGCAHNRDGLVHRGFEHAESASSTLRCRAWWLVGFGPAGPAFRRWRAGRSVPSPGDRVGVSPVGSSVRLRTPPSGGLRWPLRPPIRTWVRFYLVRKPKGGSNGVRWQHPASSRTRQWSKTLRSKAVHSCSSWQRGADGGASGRREGKGRGDAVRLLTRGNLRRVMRHKERHGVGRSARPALLRWLRSATGERAW